MSTEPGGRAGHEDDHDYVDKDVAGAEPRQREGDITDKDVAPAAPTAEREGEYTDSDVGPDDTDPPKGSYVSGQGPQ